MRRPAALHLLLLGVTFSVLPASSALAARASGIDVSHYQGTITASQWTQVFNNGKTFAWTKADESNVNAYNDSTFVNNMINGRNAGLYMGAYHFARPEDNTDATIEAQHFLNVVQPNGPNGANNFLGSGYFRPMLDIETGGVNTTAGKAYLSDWINTFCDYIVAHGGGARVEPLVYMNSNYATSYVNSTVATRDLDVANYGSNPVDPPVPTGNPSTGVFPTWAFWQYGSQGRVPGIGGGTSNVDMDVANGDINFVKQFVIGGVAEQFDVNGTTAGSGVVNNGSYTWEAAGYSSTATGDDPVSWVNGNFLRLAAGTDAAASNYTITANSNHTVAGMLLQTGGGGTVTVDGAGVLSIASGDQGFYVSTSSQNLKINAVLAGSGQLVWQGSGSGTGNQSGGSLFLLGNNTYTGGTALNAGSGVNFNNDHSFGTGRITLGYTGGTATQFVLANDVATAPVTLANPVTTLAGATLIYVGPASAPVTFTGAWTLPTGTSTLSIGNPTHTSSKMTISGAMGGSGGALVKSGVGTLVLSGTNTYDGTTTISAGTLQLGNGGTTGKLSTASAIINNSSLIFNRTNTMTQGTDFTGSAISGTGSLTQAGSGTLILNAANSYIGKTFVNAGTLSISSDGNLGTAPGSVVADQLTFNGGTLKVTAGFTMNSKRGITINSPGGTFNITSGALGVSSTITNTSGSTVTISGGGDFNPSANNSTFTSGKWNITGGSRWLNANNDNNSGADPAAPVADFFTFNGGTYVNNGGHTLNANKGITLGVNPLVFSGGAIDTVNGNMTYNGVITGPGTFTKLSANTLTLGGANTYTNSTTISGGILQLGGGGTTGSLSTASAIIDNANLTVNRSNTVTQGIDFTANAITGSGSLTQAGTGSLILNAANTYSGGTTVSAGALSVSAIGTLGSGDVTVQDTAAGTSLMIQTGVANAINDGATLSLAGGGTAGIADRGYANLASGISEVVNSLLLGGTPQTPGLTYGSTSSGAVVQSDEYFSGTGVVSVGLQGDFNDDGSVDNGDYLGWRKSPSTLGGTAGYDLWRSNFGTTAAASSSSGSLSSQTAVPEPGTMILALIGAAAMTMLRSRRRMKS